MMFPVMVLIHICSYLEIEDLTRATDVCFDWWKLIARGRYLKEAEMYELDLSETENLYHFLPLKMFATLKRLNISSTKISNRHFLQIIYTAENLEYLDISNCTSVEQSSSFEIKNAVLSRGLEYVDISGNQEKFTILAVVCLCSCENIQTIVAHGYNFNAEELLFLSSSDLAKLQNTGPLLTTHQKSRLVWLGCSLVRVLSSTAEPNEPNEPLNI